MSEVWTFLTNHARTLLHIARDPNARMVDIAAEIGITERAVQQIVSDLESGGYIRRHRAGRRNTYEVNMNASFRHPSEADHQVRELIYLFR
ncbi:MAG: helix-turn-helix transcriptional regulator [Actinomycetota bacterium]